MCKISCQQLGISCVAYNKAFKQGYLKKKSGDFLK